ncbi:hypothetical protein Tco_0704102 [Tanacetum coccineum]|uniref:Uncharacterized protein n=1 Tax=Tanacetum coccineum TaxID=301880 RepID=A0ABQ4Y160_9ASTR
MVESSLKSIMGKYSRHYGDDDVLDILGLNSRSGSRFDTVYPRVGYGVLVFLGVGTTLDIFQNIILIPYFQYDVLVFWIRRIDLHSYVVFGECRHGYAVSSLMDTAYWLPEQ